MKPHEHSPADEAGWTQQRLQRHVRMFHDLEPPGIERDASFATLEAAHRRDHLSQQRHAADMQPEPESLYSRISLEFSHSWPGQAYLRLEAANGAAVMVRLNAADRREVSRLLADGLEGRLCRAGRRVR